jgi:adenosine deaminase
MTAEGLERLVFKPHYADLREYLQGFAYTTAVLQDAEALEQVAYELAQDNIDEGVCYMEVRFAPQLHMHAGLDFDAVMSAVDRGMARAQREHEASAAVRAGAPPFRYGIIVAALRRFDENFSRWYQQLVELFPLAPRKEVYGLASLELARAAVRCRDRLGVPVVGFDLAGEEAGYPAHDHAAAFAHAHQHFLKGTVHAGEAYGPESIFDAITELHSDRIGHGYHLFSADLCGPDVEDPQDYVRRLAEYIADRRITVEVCITSNLQTNPAIGEVKNHAFGRMLEARLSATLCTDNRLVSHTTVTRELQLAVETFQMDRSQIRDTIIYGFKRSFYPGSYREKRAYVRSVIDAYDRTWAAHHLKTADRPSS